MFINGLGDLEGPGGLDKNLGISRFGASVGMDRSVARASCKPMSHPFASQDRDMGYPAEDMHNFHDPDRT